MGTSSNSLPPEQLPDTRPVYVPDSLITFQALGQQSSCILSMPLHTFHTNPQRGGYLTRCTSLKIGQTGDPGASGRKALYRLFDRLPQLLPPEVAILGWQGVRRRASEVRYDVTINSSSADLVESSPPGGRTKEGTNMI